MATGIDPRSPWQRAADRAASIVGSEIARGIESGCKAKLDLIKGLLDEVAEKHGENVEPYWAWLVIKNIVDPQDPGPEGIAWAESRLEDLCTCGETSDPCPIHSMGAKKDGE
jgi:hypothetical protein